MRHLLRYLPKSILAGDSLTILVFFFTLSVLNLPLYNSIIELLGFSHGFWFWCATPRFLVAPSGRHYKKGSGGATASGPRCTVMASYSQTKPHGASRQISTT